MKRLLPLLAAVALLASGCGGKKTAATTTGVTTTPPATTTAPAGETTTVELYFLGPDGKLVAASRTVPRTEAIAGRALDELADPPPGMKTEVPCCFLLTLDGSEAQISGRVVTKAAFAQMVYTLTAFPSIKTVQGETRKLDEVEAFVPAILVEHPTPDETVMSPLRVTGTANTFEATFQYKLEDANGKVLAQHFVTATSGSGTRGTFDFTVPFTVDAAQDGTLVVYENSAENGAVIHERRIPLRLTP